MTLWETTAHRMLGGGEAPPVVEPAPGDRRFRAEAWQQNEIFDFIKQSYLLTANAMQEMVGKLNGLDEKERDRVAFYTRQFADALAPTNFPLTNPDVLKATIASNGENLVKGLDNLLGRYRARPGRAFHPPIRRRLHHRREYRHRARAKWFSATTSWSCCNILRLRMKSISGRC